MTFTDADLLAMLREATNGLTYAELSSLSNNLRALINPPERQTELVRPELPESDEPAPDTKRLCERPTGSTWCPVHGSVFEFNYPVCARVARYLWAHRAQAVAPAPEPSVEADRSAVGSRARVEWRAVFEHPKRRNPGGAWVRSFTYGPARSSRAEAGRDRSPRSEEDHSVLAGVQRRTVTEWEDA